MMKIVLEGFDGSGKSTLADSLSEYFNLPIIWAGGPPKDDVEAYKNCRSQLSAMNCILDRITPISRVCYEGKNISIQHGTNLLVVMEAMKIDSVVVYCTHIGPQIIKKYDTAKHLLTVLTDESNIRTRYDNLMFTIPHFKYDYEIHDVESLIKDIKRRDHELTISSGRTGFN
jgi:hypothetical protein